MQVQGESKSQLIDAIYAGPYISNKTLTIVNSLHRDNANNMLITNQVLRTTLPTSPWFKIQSFMKGKFVILNPTKTSFILVFSHLLIPLVNHKTKV